MLLAHGIFGVAHLDRKLDEFELVVVNLMDDLAVVFVAISFGIDSVERLV